MKNKLSKSEEDYNKVASFYLKNLNLIMKEFRDFTEMGNAELLAVMPNIWRHAMKIHKVVSEAVKQKKIFL